MLDPAELEKASRRFMAESRRGDIMHETDAPARVFASLVVDDTIAQVLKVGTKERGWFVGFEVDTKSDLWRRIKAGEIRELSIAGDATKTLLEDAA